MEIIRLDSTTSTNDFMLELARKAPQWEGVVTSDYQSAGKGMGKNTWESEQGKNLLFSILLHPLWLPVHEQYLLSMAHAIALQEVLAQYADGFTVKWPNDIYWRNRKISGTRIDVNVKGQRLADVIIGTGVNVNQQEFKGDAPNPISLLHVTGREHDPYVILQQIILRFGVYLSTLKEGRKEDVIRRYHDLLYRREGYHEYEDDKGVFRAKIVCVKANGVIELETVEGGKRFYMFKEVRFINEE